MSAPFEFTMRYVDRSTDGYYVTRWDKAVTTTVIAPTRPEAFAALWAMLGSAPRGRTWTAVVDRARQLTPAECAPVDKRVTS